MRTQIKFSQKELNEIAKKYHLKLVILFGSQSRGHQNAKSDVNIAVLGDKNIEFEKTLRLIGDLSGVFHREIDLSILNTASPLLKYQVAKHGRALYGKKRDVNNFKVMAIIQYIDAKKLLNLEDEYIRKPLKLYAHR